MLVWANIPVGTHHSLAFGPLPHFILAYPAQLQKCNLSPVCIQLILVDRMCVIALRNVQIRLYSGSWCLVWLSCRYDWIAKVRFCLKLIKGIAVTHPTVMSKMLLPTELDTAMSPRPFRATITLVIRSGIDVPAARMVRPIISSEMATVSPTYSNKQTNKIK